VGPAKAALAIVDFLRVPPTKTGRKLPEAGPVSSVKPATSRPVLAPSKVVAVRTPTPLISLVSPLMVIDPPPTVRMPVILASPLTTRAVTPAPGVPIVAPEETKA
jgi:hypothetical protein